MNANYLIEVVPYNSNWPELFMIEAKKIKEALGDNCITVHHIGSTSVPNLSAKPIIDIIPVVHDILSIDTKALVSLGYTPRGEFGMPFRRFFQKGDQIRTHNLHIWEVDYPEVQKHLLFRDFLINHPKDRDQYAASKSVLAKNFQNDPCAYANGKIHLINELIEQSGFDNYLFVQALTDDHWKAYHYLRKDHPFDPQDASHDKYPKNHFHFVFTKGCKVIGASQVEFSEAHSPCIKFIVLDRFYQSKELLHKFFTLIERWIQHQNRLRLHQKNNP